MRRNDIKMAQHWKAAQREVESPVPPGLLSVGLVLVDVEVLKCHDFLFIANQDHQQHGEPLASWHRTDLTAFTGVFLVADQINNPSALYSQHFLSLLVIGTQTTEQASTYRPENFNILRVILHSRLLCLRGHSGLPSEHRKSRQFRS